jgi:hypothetical protein
MGCGFTGLRYVPIKLTTTCAESLRPLVRGSSCINMCKCHSVSQDHKKSVYRFVEVYEFRGNVKLAFHRLLYRELLK